MSSVHTIWAKRIDINLLASDPKHRHSHMQKLPKSPWALDPMDQQVMDLGTPESMMNRHLNLALILTMDVV